MNLHEFKRDYKEEFYQCVDDLDWEKIFNWLNNGNLRSLSNLDKYLRGHFQPAIEDIESELKPEPDHDAEYDAKRQEKADNAVSFEDAVDITNMKMDGKTKGNK